MKLFDFLGLGKKKEKSAPVCACMGEGGAIEASASDAAKQVNVARDGVISLKVLGTGCASCHTLLENTRAAVKHMGLGVEVEYVTDMVKIAGYGVMSVPALVVNEKVVAIGKVLKAAEVEKLLKELGGG